MSDQWPPPAPGINKAFKKAHDKDKSVPPTEVRPPVSKKEIEELEEQRKKAVVHRDFTPTGIRVDTTTVDQHREKNIKEMKKRLQEPKNKARENFERSNER